jgi:hypothetical protein
VRFSAGRDNQITFSISGYEFPDATEGYDANWLVLNIDAVAGSERWQAEAACLLTWDVVLIRHWFRTIAEGKKPRDKRWCGMETDFTLLYRGSIRENHHFYVRLSYGLAPHRRSGPDECVTFPVEVDGPGLVSCCGELDQMVKLFPLRGQIGQKWSAILKEQGHLV